MDMNISIKVVCSDLHKFLERKTAARSEFINSLVNSFPKDKKDIARFRKGDVGPETLAKWVFAHPTCIPLLRKCLEKHEKCILEHMKIKAKEYGTSVSKTNTVAGNFFKVWGTEYENVAEEATLERISKLEDTTKLVVQHLLKHGNALSAQKNKIQELQAKIESLEQEIHRKDEQIKTLTEENKKLKEVMAEQVEKHTAQVRKIEELEKEKKALEEEKVERQAEKERLMQDNYTLKQKINDLEDKDKGSDEIR